MEDHLDIPDSFSGRLALALKVVNLSPAALGAAVGVDKSVVSRWLSGKVRPSGHNLVRIASEIARLRPGFSTLAFEAPRDHFMVALDLADAGLPAATVATRPTAGGDGLILPFDAINDARKETERRGVEYFGHYSLYYWSFTRPGRIARMAMLLCPRDGLIEARYGAQGFEFGGWALLLMNRLYVQLSEKRFQAMIFMVTNPGQQPVARRLTGLMMGPSDRLMVPTASPMVLERERDLIGDHAADTAAFESAQNFDPFADGEAAPHEVRACLENMVTMTRVSESGVALVQVPTAEAEG